MSEGKSSLGVEAYPPLRPLVVSPQQQSCATLEQKESLTLQCTLRDVSARRWEERQLSQSQRLEAVGRLASGISNDYSQLLGVIRNHADHLLRQFDEYPPARKAVEEIHQAATAADRITGRLALFGTRRVCQQEVLSVNSILRLSAKLIETIAGVGVDVTIRTQPTAGRIKANAGQLKEAIISLVMHACATMAGGGRLLIETADTEIPGRGHQLRVAGDHLHRTGGRSGKALRAGFGG